MGMLLLRAYTIFGVMQWRQAPLALVLASCVFGNNARMARYRVRFGLLTPSRGFSPRTVPFTTRAYTRTRTHTPTSSLLNIFRMVSVC